MDKKTIIITGASSGLGASIAKEYAIGGHKLFLFGRSLERLEKLKGECLLLGAEATIYQLDICNKQLMRQSIAHIARSNKVDIVIACAGISAGTLNHPETLIQVDEIVDTNLGGVVSTIMPALPFMVQRKSGTIVLVSSMAGLLGLSSASSYCASKAAVKVLGDSLRGYLKQFKVSTCVVIPGYIKTPMTQVNKFPMPFLMDSEKAARIIVSGIESKKGLIVFPKFMYFFMKFLNLLPYQIIDYINSKLPGKPALHEEID